MTLGRILIFFAVLVFIAVSPPLALGQSVKRLVVVKIDGLPGYYVDRFVKEKDPETGLSMLPWIERVFYRNGTRVPNFYTRGMSLSGPSHLGTTMFAAVAVRYIVSKVSRATGFPSR